MLASAHDAAVCLMHNREAAVYDELVPDVIKDLERCLAIAEKHGVKREKIILDPGIGFGKTYEQNLEIMNH